MPTPFTLSRFTALALRSSCVLSVLLVLSCQSQTPNVDKTETARVTKVRDGDTIELEDGRAVRLNGIDTPERGQPYADSATALTTQLTLGKTVRLEQGYDRIDRYGRTLAFVYADKVQVNRELIRQGLAWCYFFEGNLVYGDQYIRAQQDAMTHHRGIWQTPQTESADHYIGSFLAYRFHRPDCKYVDEIKLQYEVPFMAKDSAYFYGYAPCGICEP